ncbi:hypothetical protein GCM10027275_06610 [Rhabdobacter roseus]|uniref:Uncharacterized membrane protein YkvA (DUF1232 family) n=1 Tax=Rhabdobacter roseus TaxID=1655419 RepID=A0A840TRE3_9BACT|nr:YkvA family protein [Rhabdobacter roseus]MBB5282558.1 uncharacterized membrane protein YkvA (DUF1232 family) [Rhabdobacter roseus]
MAENSLIARVLRSIFFRKATGRAGRYARNSSRLFTLLTQVAKKSQQLGFKESVSVFQTQVQVLIRMIRAYASGEYRGLPWKSLVSIIATLIYFVSPIDLIPDILPVVGFTDDLALVVWVFKSFSDDIEKFSAWENKRKTINIG